MSYTKSFAPSQNNIKLISHCNALDCNMLASPNSISRSWFKNISLAAIMLLAVTSVSAQDSILQNSVASNCSSGYAETWIVGQSCFIGSSADVKTDDAIHISCSGNNEYSIAFYLEPANSDPAAGSQAVAHKVCPGNGYITSNADGEQVLRCNFWESSDNIAKQLDIQLQPLVTGQSGRSMNWKVSEQENPNVVCGVSGRPNDDSDTAGSGRTS